MSRDGAAADVTAYCNAWHAAVAAAGYEPGLYVGYRPGLSARQLYRDLAFARDWGAYNVDADQTPVRRGWCLEQRVGSAGTVAGIDTQRYDDDVTTTDALGGKAHWLCA